MLESGTDSRCEEEQLLCEMLSVITESRLLFINSNFLKSSFTVHTTTSLPQLSAQAIKRLKQDYNTKSALPIYPLDTSSRSIIHDGYFTQKRRYKKLLSGETHEARCKRKIKSGGNARQIAAIVNHCWTTDQKSGTTLNVKTKIRDSSLGKNNSINHSHFSAAHWLGLIELTTLISLETDFENHHKVEKTLRINNDWNKQVFEFFTRRHDREEWNPKKSREYLNFVSNAKNTKSC